MTTTWDESEVKNTYLNRDQITLEGDSDDVTETAKPSPLVRDNGFETLILTYARFECVIEGEKDSHGSIMGYIFK